VITHNADLAIAEQIVSLMWDTGDYREIFIECDGERLSPDRDN
jgi:hypothetical protein